MTTARFEMRDGAGMLILTDGNHVVELNQQEAAAAIDLWHKHMRPIWDKAQADKEQAERDAMSAHYRQFEVRKQFGGPNGYETWVLQMHPDNPTHAYSAWPDGTSRDEAPIGVGLAMRGKNAVRPYQIEYRATSWGGNSYMTDWGTARYATIDAAIKAAIRNRPAIMDDFEASRKRNAARAA